MVALRQVTTMALSTYLVIAVSLGWTMVSGAPSTAKSQMLIMSFDGFRYDYYDRFKDDLDTLTAMADNGVHLTNGIKSVFTTKTFPAHWSIATGLYEESHGLMGNNFFDPDFNETFAKSLDKKWWGGEPLWVTAKRAGKKVGVFMWVGSEVDFGAEVMPDSGVIKYNTSVPLAYRIDTVIQWLTVDKYDLVMSYWNQPDESGHKHGPFSPEVHSNLTKINDNLRVLLNALNETQTLANLNMIVTADHGMAETKVDPVVYLDNYVNTRRDLRHMDEAPVVAVWPKSGVDTEDILHTLKQIKANITTYSKSEIPDRWHYTHNRRVPPILMVADEGYLVQRNNKSWVPEPGNHGFDNDLMVMRPLFFAMGPGFKKNHKMADTFELVNIYPMACHLMGIEASPNNGSFELFSQILASGSRPLVGAQVTLLVFVAMVTNYFLA
ncbi:Ectonucleotide pyrophosphatase/phosphodiesterase family member 5 [Halotydeus destructor]|nr:Ectonucleotide pyrophosphatase/phosphodiesterase family member 5 [Halotydeus destructor]